MRAEHIVLGRAESAGLMMSTTSAAPGWYHVFSPLSCSSVNLQQEGRRSLTRSDIFYWTLPANNYAFFSRNGYLAFL